MHCNKVSYKQSFVTPLATRMKPFLTINLFLEFPTLEHTINQIQYTKDQ